MLRDGDIFEGTSGESYEVGETLGKGGFGIVHSCKRLSDGVFFVCKSPTDNSDLKTRKLTSEFNILNDLQNRQVPNVVRAIELGFFQDGASKLPVLIMEKVRGNTLNRVIKEKLTTEQAIGLLSILASTLAEIHKVGYIHRDIKPDNIMVEKQGQDFNVTIIDFGIAAIKEDQNTFAVTSSVAHTRFFAPPEQAKGTVSIGNDIFSLGATGYYLLVGSEQCSKDNKNAITTPYNPITHMLGKDKDSQHLGRVISKATQTIRQNRFATMSEFFDMLSGREPDENFPRFVIDGDSFIMESALSNWLMGRYSYGAEIEVKETAAGGSFISRKQAKIERLGSCSFKMYHLGKNDTRVGIQQSNGEMRWKKIGEKGWPFGPKYVQFCVGYSETPPGKFDINGDPLLPGPYKVLEYFPPSETNSLSGTPSN